MIQNSSKTVVWSWDHYAFADNAPNQNPFGAGNFPYNQRLPGQYKDSETGLNYNYFRDCYNPVTGRYCQSDPLGLLAGINTYGYVNANPLSFIDPWGLQSLSFTTVSGGPNLASWSIKWQLSDPSAAGGWIVQQVQGNLVINGVDDPYNFWEAWYVAAGSETAISPNPRYDDIFLDDVPSIYRGSDSLTATARFYEGACLPSTFQKHNPHTFAKSLPSTTINPNLPTTNATGPVVRTWSTQF